MSATFEELLSPLDRDAIFAQARALLEAAGEQVGPTDEPAATVYYESDLLVGLSVLIVETAKLAVMRKSSGDALTIHVKDAYGLDRTPPIQLLGEVTLTDSTGAPQPYAAGALIFATSAGSDLVYRNTDAIVVPASGSLPNVAIHAEGPGAIYNVGGQTLYLATTVIGLTLSVATGNDWITRDGANEESDTSLIQRAEGQWALLSPGGSYDFYVAAARAGSTGINRVRVQEDPLAVVPDPSVVVYLAGPSGAPTATALLDAQTYIAARQPLGIIVEVNAATEVPFELRGTVKVKAAYKAAAKAYVEAQLGTWFSGERITVNGEIVEGLGLGVELVIAQIVEIIMSAPGVVDVALTDAAIAPLTANVIPSADAVFTLVNLLTDASYVSV
jgi:phage-related baseplate assembly protein